MPTDGRGNRYEDIADAVRITYVRSSSRSPGKDWAEGDVVRIQAYKGKGDALHRGAEIPLRSPSGIVELIEALCRLQRRHTR